MLTRLREEATEIKHDLACGDVSRQRHAVQRLIHQISFSFESSAFLHLQDTVRLISRAPADLRSQIYLYLEISAPHDPEKLRALAPTLCRELGQDNPILRAQLWRILGILAHQSLVDVLNSYIVHCLRSETNTHVLRSALLACSRFTAVALTEVTQRAWVSKIRDLLLSAKQPSVIAAAAYVLFSVWQQKENTKDVSYEGCTEEECQILIEALDHCDSWDQCSILGYLQSLEIDAVSSELLLEKACTRLHHSNGGVVMAAVRLAIHALLSRSTTNDIKRSTYTARLVDAFLAMALLSYEDDTKFAALHFLGLLSRYLHNHSLSSNDLQALLPKSQDTPSVQIEKLSLLVRFSRPDDVLPILNPILRWSHSPEQSVAIHAIYSYAWVGLRWEGLRSTVFQGLIASLEHSAENGVVLETVLHALVDHLRRYPSLYVKSVASVCSKVAESIASSGTVGRISFLWLIGSFAKAFGESAFCNIELVAEHCEPLCVEEQLALLTATSKLYVSAPSTQIQDYLYSLLQLHADNDNIELRERALFYWRLLTVEDTSVRSSLFLQNGISTDPPRASDSEIQVLEKNLFSFGDNSCILGCKISCCREKRSDLSLRSSDRKIGFCSVLYPRQTALKQPLLHSSDIEQLKAYYQKRVKVQTAVPAIENGNFGNTSSLENEQQLEMTSTKIDKNIIDLDSLLL